MSKSLIASLLLGSAVMVGATIPAQAATTRATLTLPEVAVMLDDVQQAREAGEAPRRENRRNDRRNDRRRAEAEQGFDAGVVLVREGGSRRGRGRDRR
jgi:hypothetical protein